jgi:cell division protein FtsQ
MKLFEKKNNSSGASNRLSRPSRIIQFRKVVPFMWLLFIAVLIAGGVEATKMLLVQPVARVVVNGDFRHVIKESITDEVMPFLSEGFIQLNLIGIQETLLRRPWVYEVTVARQWPNEVVINVVEQTPIARWGKSGFLNHRGELFLPVDSLGLRFPKDLPLLDGPDASANELIAYYREWHNMLREKNLNVYQLSLDQGLGWTAVIGSSVLNNRVSIVLGRDDVMGKMRRFIAAYDLVLIDKFIQVDRIDMRYNSGLAVRWIDASKMLKNNNGEVSRVIGMNYIERVESTNFRSVC